MFLLVYLDFCCIASSGSLSFRYFVLAATGNSLCNYRVVTTSVTGLAARRTASAAGPAPSSAFVFPADLMNSQSCLL